MTLAGKHILLMISGGIAAYKSISLIRLIQKAGGSVQAILTHSATQFVSPLTISTLCGRPALTELFDLTRETEIGHIELSRSADLIVVAPATANLLAKLANGHADDLASTCLLATDTAIVAAPAMNVRMWEAAPTRRNIEVLRKDGIAFIGPNQGDMACGEFGFGRMAEPEEILQAINAHFEAQGAPKPLAGKHVVVTSGPTREPFDPVRYISNASSGRQGTAIAEALAALGARVTFVTGPAEHANPKGASVIPVTTALEMKAAVEKALPADAAVFCAAVADWRVESVTGQKVKKTPDGAPPEITLVENPDILASIAQLPADRRPSLVVGFAAETGELETKARAKLTRKRCDWLLANDVGGSDPVFGSTDTAILFLNGTSVEDWGSGSKTEVARKLADRIAGRLSH